MNTEHFVLVHGAGHGAWCWFRLICLLQDSGHRVSAVDLAGAAGSLVDPNDVRSFDDYNAPLLNLMAALPDGDKVILVGHSAGGLTVTHAMHLFGDRIKQAIFIAATMLPFGYQTEQDIKDGVPDLSEHGDVYDLTFGLGADHPPTSVALRKEFQRIILYQQSPEEDSALASILLRPWPTALSMVRFGADEGVESVIHRVRRVYIKTANDRMVKPEQQEAMIRRWPPSEVMVMDTDHSPLFSATEHLFTLILKSLDWMGMAREHFVLVHGEGHGAWCWFKLRWLLESSGYRVTCIDLAGGGVDPTDPNTVLSFEHYDKPLLELISAMPEGEKVILVGHGAGGLSLIHVMHQFVDRIRQAIFVAATMLPFGLQTDEDKKDGLPTLPENEIDLTFGTGADDPPTTAALRSEFQRDRLSQQSPEEESVLASMLMRPWPVTAISTASFEGDDERLNRIKRVFIKTERDHMLDAQQQDSMIKKWPPSE
ncbi:hypothetical protein E2562_007631, partial [Oryza meyeriana var. granulata]